MNWHVFGKAFLCETLYSIPFFILALFPFRKQLRFPLKSITFSHFSGTAVPVILLCVSCCARKTYPDNGYNLCRGLPKSLLSMRKSQCVETAFPVFFHFQLYGHTSRNLLFSGKLVLFRFGSNVLFTSQ